MQRGPSPHNRLGPRSIIQRRIVQRRGRAMHVLSAWLQKMKPKVTGMICTVDLSINPLSVYTF